MGFNYYLTSSKSASSFERHFIKKNYLVLITIENVNLFEYFEEEEKIMEQIKEKLKNDLNKAKMEYNQEFIDYNKFNLDFGYTCSIRNKYL